MTHFLERIEVSGVRSIGWSSDGGPGLVLDGLGLVNIVSAPNGVGKTSIVDALTLALTGEPRRRGRALVLNAVIHAPRTEALKASVALRFSGGHELRWEGSDETGRDPSLVRIRSDAAALLSKEPSDPDVVASLLRLTHLLPQGWGERFTDQNGGERWALVERAFGLEGVRSAVKAGQGRGPIGTVLADTTRVKNASAEGAAKALVQWEECARRWVQAREGAGNAGARSPHELKPELDTIAAELGVQAGTRPLVRLREVIGERRAATGNALETAERLYRRQQEAEAQIAGADAVYETAEAAFREAEANLESARVAVTRADGAAARVTLPKLRAARERAEATERACTMFAHAAALDAYDAALRDAEARLSTLPEVGTLDKEVADAEAAEEASLSEREDAHRHLSELERVHGDLAGLLRKLRSHVAHDPRDPQECPVCGTGFPAITLLDRLDARLGVLGDAATDEAHARHAHAEARVSEATSLVRGARERRDAVARTRVETKRARDAALEGIAGVRALYPALVGEGAQNTAALAEALRAGARALVPDDRELTGTALDAARRASDAAALAILAADEAVRACDALSSHTAEAVTPEVARHRREHAQKVHQVADNERATADRRRAAARRARDGLAAEWASLPFPELAGAPPDLLPAKLEAVRQARTLALDLAAAQLDAAERSASAYARHDVIRLAEDALRMEARACDADVPDEIGEAWIAEVAIQLKARETTAKAEAEALKRRADRVTTWIGSLADELQKYERDCLKELDPVVNRFLDALAPTMRWRMKLDKHRSEARTSFANSEAPSVDPSDLLSEGEHTAVALAYLLSFHTRFPWSRWPALVLDDPFQAADVVRVGALLDLLRGLSVARGTQLLLTTHDPQLAEWARRKMRNAGVDARLYELERTAEGVRAGSR